MENQTILTLTPELTEGFFLLSNSSISALNRGLRDLIIDHFTVEFTRPYWLIEVLDDVKSLFSFLDMLLLYRNKPASWNEVTSMLESLAMRANLVRLNRNLRTLIADHNPFMAAEIEWWRVFKIEVIALFNFFDAVENDLIKYYVFEEERP